MSEDSENRNSNDASGEETLNLTDPRVKIKFVELLQSVLHYNPGLSFVGCCASRWFQTAKHIHAMSFDMPFPGYILD